MFVVLNNMKLYAYVTKGPPDPLRAHIFQDSALRLHQISYLLCAYCDVSFAHDMCSFVCFGPWTFTGPDPVYMMYRSSSVLAPASVKAEARRRLRTLMIALSLW